MSELTKLWQEVHILLLIVWFHEVHEGRDLLIFCFYAAAFGMLPIIIATIAGTGTGSYSGDNGAATSATLYYPWGVAVDASGRILSLLSAAPLHSE